MKLIKIACLLLFYTVCYCQESSFIKIFDNGELGFEYVGYLQQDNFSTVNLYSTGRISDDFGGVFKVREVELSGNILGQENLNNDRGSSIDASKHTYSIGTKSYDLGADNINLEIVKISSEEIIWKYEYGIENNFERGYGIDIDNNGDIVACGLVAKELGGVDNESVVLKIDTLGNEIWTRKIKARYNELKARAVTTDDTGNIYVLADEESLFPTVQQVALIKLNSQGDSLWTKYYPGNASLAKDIKFNQDGNLTASVTADYDGNGRSFTMLELDTSGTVLWTKSYIEELGVSPFAERFIELRDGGYAVCLNINYPVLLVLDRDGNITNEQHYDGYGVSDVRDLIELHDGSFAIAGNITEFNQEIPKTMWLIKTNSDGELITSTIEAEYPQFNLYPNPTIDEVEVEGIDYRYAMLLSSTGELLSRYDKEETIDLKEIPIGTYYLSLQTEKGIFTEKIVKGNR